jgi:hypothetical protein
MRGLWGDVLRLLLSLSLVVGTLGCLVVAPEPTSALIHVHPDEHGQTVVRSLESLRDLDDQSWQLVAYCEGPPGGLLRLRIVGYPGKVRLEHPVPLSVESGAFRWSLEDLTKETPALASDGRAAAAEFDLAPLLADLHQDRPLRLALPGVFSALVVPPYVVSEWRRLTEQPNQGGTIALGSPPDQEAGL